METVVFIWPRGYLDDAKRFDHKPVLSQWTSNNKTREQQEQLITNMSVIGRAAWKTDCSLLIKLTTVSQYLTTEALINIL